MGTNDNAQARSRSPGEFEPPARTRHESDATARAPGRAGDAVDTIRIPGAPSSQPPPLHEPTTPQGPLPPKPEQQAPRPVSPTGVETGTDPDGRAQSGSALTTAQGLRLSDTDHSLKAGSRGP